MVSLRLYVFQRRPFLVARRVTSHTLAPVRLIIAPHVTPILPFQPNLPAGMRSQDFLPIQLDSPPFLATDIPMDKNFFETSALIVTLTMARRVVSVLVRGHTTSAFDAGDVTQAGRVDLAKNNIVQSIPAERVHKGGGQNIGS